jgi:hypothetical protein
MMMSKLKLTWAKWPLRWQLRNLYLGAMVRWRFNKPTSKHQDEALNLDQQLRLNAYCKLQQVQHLPDNALTASDLSLKKRSHYVGDLWQVLVPHFLNSRFLREFGDVTWVPAMPAFVKSRPIADNNQNAVLLPLDARRHLVFPEDPFTFDLKQAKIVWRGAATQMHRQKFLSRAHGMACCDVGDPSLPMSHPHHRPRLSMFGQMRFKYLVSIEGNDVATNLKWIMNSNSLCLMPKPRFETWFLESQLQAGVHYVELDDDFSNLQAVFGHYEQNPEEALQIIQQAHAYTNKFKDRGSERLMTQQVVSKYFDLCK